MATVEDFTKRCDDPAKLVTMVLVMVELAMAEIAAKKVKADLFETYRSQERQNWIYCQGRTAEECIKAGIPAAFAKKYADPKAGENTWTLSSKHKTGKAVDIVPYINGKLTWSHTAKEQLAIVEVMERLGFECGTNWTKNRDSCHYQVDGSFTTYFDAKHTTKYVTTAIQTQLNKWVKTGKLKLVGPYAAEVIEKGLKVDGDWGAKTTFVVNAFRQAMGYKTQKGQIGAIAYKALFSI